MDEWNELEQLFEELRGANEAWASSAEAVQRQVESFRPVTADIDRHFDEIGVYEALLRLGARLLSDAARIHSARLHFGLVRSALIAWYPLDDPRPDRSTMPPQGQYTIEIRMGPGYLLGARAEAGLAGDQRLAIMIEGERQLVATLPISGEKFRAALLRAFQAPHYAGPGRETEGEAAAAEAPAATDAGVATDGDTPSGEAERAAEPAVGSVETPSEPSARAAQTEAAQEAPKRRRSRSRAAKGGEEPASAPPTGDEPIPMPAASGSQQE